GIVLAECLVRIGYEYGEKVLAIVADVERAVVGDELGEQRYDKQDRKDPQRDVAAPIALEVVPAAAIDRRQREEPPHRPEHLAGRRGDGPLGGALEHAGVHLTPPGSRNRCADRSTCR